MTAKVERAASATHGNDVSPSFPELEAMESQGNSVAVPFLNDEIERSGLPRKQLAAVLGKTEATFSKMTTTGPNAQAFGLDAFEQLPLAIQIAWLKRYGRSIGLEVHELSALAVAEAIVERFEEFSRFVRMFQIGKARMAPAQTTQSKRRSA